jgi:putative flippase GtrA
VSAPAVGGRLQLAQAFLRDIRSPRWGVAGQLIRFVLSGSIVAVVYVSTTTALHVVFAVPFQLALTIGFLVSLGLHFTLQRVFVWRHTERFALGARNQVIRYLGVAGSQYGLTALATSQLPRLVGLPVEAVYLLTMATIAVFNFIVFRGRIFHPDANAKREAMS